MPTIFDCIQILQTKKIPKKTPKLYESFPNKEVIKYYYIGLNTIINDINKK